MKIKFFTKFFCTMAVLFTLTDVASAKTISLGFNLGDVVAAEFTAAPAAGNNIIGKEESPVFPAYRNMRYVAVVLKMQKGRSVEQFDYSLTINGVKAECVAIASGMNSFDCNPHKEFADSNAYIRMLYVFDGAKVRPGAVVAGTLTLNYATTADRLRAVRFNITNIGNRDFTPVNKIPAAGLLK